MSLTLASFTRCAALCGLAALTGLSACAPQIPDSAAGVGFDNSIEAQRRREAALATGAPAQPLAPPGALSSETRDAAVQVDPAASPGAAAPLGDPLGSIPGGPPPVNGGDDAEEIARQTAAALAAAGSPQTPPPLPVDNPGLSDENDFQAVASRETIESDAERIARNRELYQQVEVPVPPREAAPDQPNIVQYALATSHEPGTRLYTRTGFNLEAKAARNCAAFPSADQAQIAFLASGGPQRDKRGLDPDGDGFACAWDPTPFRRAVRN